MAVLQEWKCPHCGGKFEFDTASQQMKCPYCGAQIAVSALQNEEQNTASETKNDIRWESDSGFWQEAEAGSMQVYTCQSCGGEIVAGKETAASKCPFCDSPVIMTGQLSGDLRPDLVIPFKLDKKAAKEALTRHVTGKRFLPKVFKDQNHIDEIKGIYVPFWLFDADVDADMQYKATRVRHWSDAQYAYTETSYFRVLRGGSLSFRAIPADGSRKMPDQLMESIEPYDITQAVDFHSAFLSGYFADRYDVTAEECIPRANTRLTESTEKAFAETVRGFSSVIPESSSVRTRKGATRYALYPVWLLNTTWNGNRYTFAINGQTGKIAGDLPLDKAAYGKALAGFTALFSLLSYGAVWLYHLFG